MIEQYLELAKYIEEEENTLAGLRAETKSLKDEIKELDSVLEAKRAELEKLDLEINGRREKLKTYLVLMQDLMMLKRVVRFHTSDEGLDEPLKIRERRRKKNK